MRPWPELTGGLLPATTVAMGIMRAGIGMIELVILLLLGGVILMALAGGFVRRRSSSTADGNPTHPRLKKCPGCGAPMNDDLGSCPQCGLRIQS